jgi:hypothetical protein
VYVWFLRFADEAVHARHVQALERSPAWRDRAAPELGRRLKGPPQVLRLAPTDRSALR